MNGSEVRRENACHSSNTLVLSYNKRTEEVQVETVSIFPTSEMSLQRETEKDSVIVS